MSFLYLPLSCRRPQVSNIDSGLAPYLYTEFQRLLSFLFHLPTSAAYIFKPPVVMSTSPPILPLQRLPTTTVVRRRTQLLKYRRPPCSTRLHPLPPRNMSPAGAGTDSSNNVHSKKKPPRSGKKTSQNPGNRTSPAPNGHRHTSSQPSNGTPMKDNAAYAGPTFHASPAPSALPIPSFFSKSFPESDLSTTLETDSEDAETEQDLETTPSKPRARPPPSQPSQPTGNGAEPSPLDFLFKAAVQARNSNSMCARSPESAARLRSPQTDSKVLPPKPQAVPGDVFAFEMGSPNQPRAHIGPAFAPSYQDRMDALRSSSSPSQSPSMTDEQRRAKNAELKHMLLNPRPQKPPSSMSPAPAPNPRLHGPYAPRPNINPSVPHYATPTRTHSGPPASITHGFSNQQQPVPNSAGPPPVSYPYANSPQQFRNTNSPLRREVPTNVHPHTRSPYGYYMPNAHMQQSDFASPQPQYAKATFNMSTNSPSSSRSMETKQMEDDLRRILNISATPTASSASSIPPGGYQSPFAA